MIFTDLTFRNRLKMRSLGSLNVSETVAVTSVTDSTFLSLLTSHREIADEPEHSSPCRMIMGMGMNICDGRFSINNMTKTTIR